MIRDPKTWEEFEASWQRNNPPDLNRHLQIFENLMEIARALGAWPPADPLTGIEVDLQIAQGINQDVRLPSE